MALDALRVQVEELAEPLERYGGGIVVAEEPVFHLAKQPSTAPVSRERILLVSADGVQKDRHQ
jgi:hypothetical protein